MFPWQGMAMDAQEIRLQAEHCRDRADELRHRAWRMTRADSYAVFHLASHWDDRAAVLEKRLRPNPI